MQEGKIKSAFLLSRVRSERTKDDEGGENMRRLDGKKRQRRAYKMFLCIYGATKSSVSLDSLNFTTLCNFQYRSSSTTTLCN